MNVAELGIKIGLNGSEDVSKGLGRVEKGMTGSIAKGFLLASTITSIVKGLAGIVGGSLKTGVSLAKFSRASQTSVETLQKYQFAAKRVGIENEKMTRTFLDLDQIMVDYRHGGTLPESLLIALQGRGVDLTDKDLKAETILKAIQEFAMENKDQPAVVRKILGGTVDTQIIDAMMRNIFTPENFKGAVVLSLGEIKRLEKAANSFKTVGHQFTRTIGKITAENAESFIKPLKELVIVAGELASIILKLVKALKVLEILTFSLKYIADVFGSVSKIGKDVNDSVSGGTVVNDFWSFLKRVLEKDFLKSFTKELPNSKSFFNPPVPKSNGKTSSNGNDNSLNNVTVNQNFNHEGKEYSELKDASKKGVLNAFNIIDSTARQIPAEGQIS